MSRINPAELRRLPPIARRSDDLPGIGASEACRPVRSRFPALSLSRRWQCWSRRLPRMPPPHISAGRTLVAQVLLARHTSVGRTLAVATFRSLAWVACPVALHLPPVVPVVPVVPRLPLPVAR